MIGTGYKLRLRFGREKKGYKIEEKTADIIYGRQFMHLVQNLLFTFSTPFKILEMS